LPIVGYLNAIPLQTTTTYNNKRHGQEKVSKILSLVNEQLLDGEVLKSQQNGFMYGHGFQDLDGHIWDIMFMESGAINQG
jgi:predicted lactoylglutathione lyase